MESGWKKLSCGLALGKPAEWLQRGCSVRERKKTMCPWDRPDCNHLSSGWVGKWLSGYLLTNHPGHPTRLPEYVDMCLWGKTLQLCLKTVPSVRMYLKCLDGKKKKKGVRVKTRIRPCRKLTVSIQVGNKHRSGNRRPMEIRYHSRRDRKATWGMSTDVCHQDPVPARWDLRRPAHWNECVALCLGEMGLRQRKAHLGKSWHLENFEYKEGKVLPAVGRVKR